MVIGLAKAGVGRRRRTAGLLLAGLAMIASPALAAQAGHAQAHASCPAIPAFAEGKFVDLKTLGPSTGELLARVKRAKADRRELERIADVRVRPGPASVVITSWGTLIPGRTVTVARRKPDGSWAVLEVHDNTSGGRRAAEPDVLVRRGGFTKLQARRLDALLADPCLYAEPIYIGNEYDLTDGSDGGCYDGGDTLVEIILPGRRRTAFQACITYGLNAQLVREIGKAAP